jgi:protein O-mannosyl-transferase
MLACLPTVKRFETYSKQPASRATITPHEADGTTLSSSRRALVQAISMSKRSPRSKRRRLRKAAAAIGGDPITAMPAAVQEVNQEPAAPPPAAGKWKVIGICAILAILTFIVFGQTLGHGFLNYDDNANVYQAPEVTRGISLQGIAWAFTHSQLGHWDPLTTLSHMLDCQLYGLRPWGHHLTNVLLHTVAVILLFLALRQMTGSTWRSAFVAAVFAIHPLRVESVAWVSERKDVLSGLFFVLTLLAYLAYVRRPESKLRYWLVTAVFALGLMSKSMVITLPFVLLLLDYWPLHRIEAGASAAGWHAARRLVVEKIPLLVLSIIFAVIQMAADRTGLLSLQKTPLILRVENALVSYAVYLRQLVWPVNLAAFYPYPRGGLEMGKVLLSLALLGAVTAGVILARKKQPWLVVGWFWYVGMLVPVIGIMQSGNLARADRYTYLPMIGVCVAGTWAAADWAGRHRPRRVALGSAAIVMLCALPAAGWRQATYWRDSETLWNHTLACTQDNFVAHNTLGLVPLDKGQFDKAITQFREALRIDPDYEEAHFNLGFALYQQGRAQDAIAEYQAALKIDPDYEQALINLGIALFQEGRAEDAIAEYRKAAQINPDLPEPHYNLGFALFQQGHTKEAIAEYRMALRTNPALAETNHNLGIALFQDGQAAEAIADIQKALELQPGDVSAENDLAWMLTTAPQTSLRDGARAIRLALQASQYSGGSNPVIFRTLAAAYAQAGLFSDAIQTAQKALQLAEDQSNAPLAGELGRELKLYEAGQPFRAPQ